MKTSPDTRAPSPTGAVLRAVIMAAGLTYDAAAKAIGATKVAVWSWCHTDARPNARFALAIERWTRGAVPASSWLSAFERARFDAVEPLPRRLLASINREAA